MYMHMVRAWLYVCTTRVETRVDVILQNLKPLLMCLIKIHFIKYSCITTTSQTPITNITKNHKYNAYGAYMSICSYVAQL